ncbi:hypothetical protein J2Q11_08650 [Tenacibaculum finnmarkense genomovar finnmarkense]|uniref:hypothetical protein n=1 Tax=Tenacibaculum finnmarkense TaxID=2781243 RepID=UPI001EFAF3F7|nr:hypothetical protein [Tenacibaculum finnmarkense]MCG8212934.1 hypothetical protein [Tenacibaculum finnmarkense genomovar finnmarkense]MCG8231195.1 hypothetical protein [Tenacibaculum finnmarkense genomovar finnmarkense]MCG8884590.1 hypothetical protein [Tenacibaculum finnmarkense]MCG8897170.1 hypothetical protein [Tenacibaculum finnmarkense]MCG8903223.1 hypothetical protein [Tenacibaculum finnmarkense]
MSEKITLIELDVSVEALLKNGAKAQAELEKLKEEANLLKKSIKEGGVTTKTYADELALLETQGKKNTQQYKELEVTSSNFSKSQDESRQKLELVTNAISNQKKEHRANQNAITDFNKIVEKELGIITETDGSINQLNRALANNKNVYKNLTKEQQENEAIGGKLIKTIAEQNSEHKKSQSVLSQRTKTVQTAAEKEELLNSVLDKEVNSITEARKQTKILTQIRNDANANTKEGAELIEKINSQLNRNTDFVKDQADAYLKSKINIGNYKESILEAFEEIDANKKVLENEIETLEQLRKETTKGSAEWIFYGEKIKENEKQMETLTGSMRTMNDEASASSSLTQLLSGDFKGLAESSKKAGGGMKLFKSGVKGATTSMKSLTKSTLSFLLTPIGIVLALVVGAFLLVKNAMNRSEESTQKITRVFSAFGGIANTVLKALEPLGVFLIDTIVKAFELAGKAADGAMNLISDGLALIGFDEASKSVDNFNKSMKQGAKDAQTLKDAEAKLQEQQRKSGIIQKQYEKQAEDQRKIRDNTALSMAKREEANKRLGISLQNQLKEEKAIAVLGVVVAKKRIELIGATKDAKDKLAEAELNVADIVERVSSQESEQLTNINSLRKEANDKEIARQQGLLELFIANQGIKARTLAEELELNKQVSKKKVEILKKELANKNITRSKFDAELQNIQNEQLKQQADIAVESAKIELDAYVLANQSKIDNDLFFSDESLRIEQERLQGIADQQTAFAKTQLDKGVINQTEYNEAINEVDETHRLAKEEAQTLRKEAQTEADVIDLENQRILDEEKFNTDFEIQTERLRIAYEAEKEAAKKNGADTTLITKKYTNAKAKIENEALQTKLTANGTAFGQIAGLLGKESALGKAAALAQAGINVAQGVTKAIAQGGFAGIATGAVVAASGLKSVQKIMTTPTKFEKGGSFMIGGKRHHSGGTKFVGDDGTAFEAEKDERLFILNREASAALGPLLSDINKEYGGVALSNQSTYLQSGGEVLRSATTSQNIKVDAGKGIDYDLLAMKIGEANMQLPKPIVQVAVEDINTGQGNYAEVVDGANLRA